MNNSKKTWQQYWLILQYHRFSAIAIFLLTITLAITTALKVERTYTVNSKIQLESPNRELIDSLTSQETGNTVKTNPQEQITAENPENAKNAEDLELNYTALTKPLFEQLKTSDKSLETLDYEQFINKLDIKSDYSTDTIEITYSGKDPQNSKLVVNSLIEFYREQKAQIDLANVKKIKDKFNQQLALADKNTKEIASQLKILLTKYDRNILESKPDYLTNKIKETEEKIDLAKSQIKEVESKINNLKSQLGLDLSSETSSNLASGSLEQQELLEQLQEIETQLILESARFNSQSPVIINLKAEKTRLEAKIKNKNLSNPQYLSVNQSNNSITETTEQLVNYEAEKKSWLTKVASWEIDKARYQKDNAIAPEIKQQYQELLVKDKQAKKQYNRLFNQAQQLEVFSEENLANIKIINPTQVKNNLASWNKEIITASGIGLGFIMALVTVLALENRNPSLKTSKEISELFNSKILGEIPNLTKSDFQISHRSKPIAPERFVLEEPYSVACEAYKIVYDNLEQIKTDQVIKLITVASPDLAEGKSTFIANLAALITQLGKKVLIIDTNLPSPKQQEIWHLDNNLGLIDILKQEAEFENVVQAPSLNLNVITTGSMVNDYLSLWKSDQMQEFTNQIQKQYDLVIFDTPAINLYPDALKISQLTDGIILVGRIGFTNPSSVVAAKELIKQSHQEILGIVVNDKFSPQ